MKRIDWGRLSTTLFIIIAICTLVGTANALVTRTGFLSDSASKFYDSVSLWFGDGSGQRDNTGQGDVQFKWNGSKFQTLPQANNTRWDIGNGTLSMDLWLYGSSVNGYLFWDASANTLAASGSTLAWAGGAITNSGTLVQSGASTFSAAVVTTGAVSNTSTATLATASVTTLVVGGGSVTKIKAYTVSWSPAQVAATSSAVATVSVSGLSTSDTVLVNKPTGQAGLMFGDCRVSATSVLSCVFTNASDSAITPTGSEVYKIFAFQ